MTPLKAPSATLNRQPVTYFLCHSQNERRLFPGVLWGSSSREKIDIGRVIKPSFSVSGLDMMLKAKRAMGKDKRKERNGIRVESKRKVGDNLRVLE